MSGIINDVLYIDDISVSGSKLNTNGSLLIGGPSGPVINTLTAGSNITITNGNGTITIAATGGGGASPLTTKGDLYTYSTTDDRLGIGANGTILIADSAQATGNKWTTATYPNTTTANQLLYSSSANTIAGLATANSATIATTNAGVPAWTGSMIDGQLLIGSTGATPTLATLTAGANITITNAAGSITITASGAGLSPLTTKGDLYTYSTADDRWNWKSASLI